MKTSAAESTRALAEYYSSHAKAYEQRWAATLLPISSQLITRLPLESATHVLDLGSGVGALLPTIKRAAPSAYVVSADRAEGMLRHAPPSIPRVVTDAAALPFSAGAFDVVVMAFVLFHVPDPVAALRAVRRVLRSGGSIGLTTWGESKPARALEIWSDELDRRGAPPAEPFLAQHELMDTPEKVSRLLIQAGFGQVNAEIAAWSDQPSLEEFIERHSALGLVGRRLAGLDAPARAAFLGSVRSKLEPLSTEDFVENADTIILTAIAP